MAEVVIEFILTPSLESSAPPREAASSLSARMGINEDVSLDLSYGSDPQSGEPSSEDSAFGSQFGDGSSEHREKGAYSQVPPNLGLVVRTIPANSREFHSKRGRRAIDAEVDDLKKDVT